jgi:phage FluMu protein Com
MESQDEKIILNSIIDTLDACIDDDISIRNLPVFDIEYLFLQVRAKSVGETSDIRIKCKSCEELNDITVNVEDIKITVPRKKTTIQISSDIHLEMKFPSIQQVINSDFFNQEKSLTERNLESIQVCIDAVVVGDDRVVFADEPREEIDNFINSLTSAQFNEVRKYVDSIPQLKHKIDFDCTSCETKNSIILQGTSDFF